MKSIFLCLAFIILRIVHVDAQQVNNSVQNSKTASDQQQVLLQKKQMAEQMQKSVIEYVIIHVANLKFGYYILIDGNLYIEQKSIPAVEGNEGFAKKEAAEIVAQLVVEKIKSGEVPPTITVEELRTLKVY